MSATFEGRTLDGYKIGKRIGKGGFASVYQAQDAQGNEYAIKFLHPGAIGNDDEMRDARLRLEREAQVINHVKSSGVAKIVDANIEGENPYVVMDLVRGFTILKDVRDNGTWEIEDLIDLAEWLGLILEELHSAAVLHRDIKPANIMVSRGGPVLIDFGIAKVSGQERLTQPGSVVGTPGYLSPQLISGEDPAPRDDWWAWLAVLLYCATGRAPFGDTFEIALARAKDGNPDVKGLPEGMARVFQAGFRPDPDSRPTPAELVAGLRAVAQGRNPDADMQIPRPSFMKQKKSRRSNIRQSSQALVGEVKLPVSTPPVIAPTGQKTPPKWQELSFRNAGSLSGHSAVSGGGVSAAKSSALPETFQAEPNRLGGQEVERSRGGLNSAANGSPLAGQGSYARTPIVQPPPPVSVSASMANNPTPWPGNGNPTGGLSMPPVIRPVGKPGPRPTTGMLPNSKTGIAGASANPGGNISDLVPGEQKVNKNSASSQLPLISATGEKNHQTPNSRAESSLSAAEKTTINSQPSTPDALGGLSDQTRLSTTARTTVQQIKDSPLWAEYERMRTDNSTQVLDAAELDDFMLSLFSNVTVNALENPTDLFPQHLKQTATNVLDPNEAEKENNNNLNQHLETAQQEILQLKNRCEELEEKEKTSRRQYKDLEAQKQSAEEAVDKLYKENRRLKDSLLESNDQNMILTFANNMQSNEGVARKVYKQIKLLKTFLWFGLVSLIIGAFLPIRGIIFFWQHNELWRSQLKYILLYNLPILIGMLIVALSLLIVLLVSAKIRKLSAKKLSAEQKL